MPRGMILNRVPAMVFYLTKAPRTAPELRTLIGTSSINTDWIARWLRAFEAEGLVQRDGFRKTGRRGRHLAVWKWVPPNE